MPALASRLRDNAILKSMRNFAHGRAFCFFAALFSAMFSACSPDITKRDNFVFGTLCSISVYGSAEESVFASVWARMKEIDKIFSANNGGSNLEKINQNAGIAPVQAPPELIYVLERAMFFAKLSEGEDGFAAFDPSIGPLVQLWNIGFGNETVPPQEKIDEALALINWRDIHINKDFSEVFLSGAGERLDLGGIAKGYAADEAVRILRNAGIKSAMINFGGNICVIGKKPSGSAFSIGVQNPRGIRGSFVEIVEASDVSVVTSGDYERYFELDGIRFHHILSTQTGCPVQNKILSVSIITERSIDADALSTTLFAAGFERAPDIIKSYTKSEGAKPIKVLFIFEDGRREWLP